MKKQFLSTLLLAGVITLFYSCSSGGGDKTAETESDYTEEAEEVTQEDEVMDEAANMMVVWHEVEDYDAWRPLYDSNLPAIQEAGMTRVAIGRENGNENNVMVVHTVGDLEAARAFATSEDLIAKMEEGGVTGEPRVHFLDVIEYKEDNITDNLGRVMFRHKISDYETFENIFSQATEQDTDNGLQFLFLGRDTDDPAMITVVDVVLDQEKAEAFIGSDELRNTMNEATVGEDVEIIYYTAEYVDDSGS